MTVGGYALYGSTTMLVLTLGKGVYLLQILSSIHYLCRKKNAYYLFERKRYIFSLCQNSSLNMASTLTYFRYGFTLDQAVGEFVLTHPNIRIKER